MIASNELKRSEEQILTQAPIQVKFGDIDYDIKPLRILKARDWRAKMIEKMQEVTGRMLARVDGEKQLMGALGYVLLEFPEVLADLVFSYSPELPQSKILDEATEEQMAKAFGKILQVAFPFQGELKTMMQVMTPPVNSRTSATSTK